MQKRQYFLKPKIFGRSSPKSIGFLRKHIQITVQNFKAIGATSFELLRDKKLTTYAHTRTYFFGKRLFFQCRIYINIENGEIRKSIFNFNLVINYQQKWSQAIIWLSILMLKVPGNFMIHLKTYFVRLLDAMNTRKFLRLY